MPTLDTDTLEMVLATLRDYAAKELQPAYLRELDERDEFPHKVLQDLYNPDKIGIHLIFIPEAYDGLGGGAYDGHRYKLSGRKQWISNGGVAKLYTILAHTPGGLRWAIAAGQTDWMPIVARCNPVLGAPTSMCCWWHRLDTAILTLAAAVA
jgi:alkylation response protein AidB-like acyl-CoA dehydrogenase